MFSVPSEMVNSLSAVRSSLAPRNSRLASSMMATNNTPTTAMPPIPRLDFLNMDYFDLRASSTTVLASRKKMVTSA